MIAPATRGREEDVFATAAEIADRDARAEFVEGACGDDPGLRASVDELLRHHDRDDFLDMPLVSPRESSGERPGTVIDRYRLIERIGEGGFGVVYRAEQSEPLAREVALKVIKSGMSSREVIARFDIERQALARMRHPNIAQVLDAGSVPGSERRPYFVMELVDGPPLDAHCESRRLGLEARLELFVEVCRAVHHAHQKGVIHRDLKPSNVLVVIEDGLAVPKVIDFGVAKAIDRPLGPESTFDLRQLVGTPEYMSPEQVAGDRDIDTRADVYALGGMLYEILAGSRPLDLESRRDARLEAILRAIREETPPRPSERLASTGKPALARRVRHDLDWVVMRALEKDRARRYQSASELAADVERYLAGEPVAARPPSAVYRTRKFLARHRVAVAAASVVVMALAIGIALAVVGLVRAERERERAERESDEARRQRAAAVEEAEKAEKAVVLLERMLGSAHPEHGYPQDYPMRKLLDELATSPFLELPGQPFVEARLRRTLGRAYLALGELAKAEPNLARALALRVAVLDDAHPLVAQSRVDYARCLALSSRLDEARDLVEQALLVLRGLGPSEDLAFALHTLRKLLEEQGDGSESESLAHEAWDIARRIHGDRHPTTLIHQCRAAQTIRRRAGHDEAEKLVRDALAGIREVRPEQHVDIAQASRFLALVLRRPCRDRVLRGPRLREAEGLVRHALDIHRTILGPVNQHVAMDLVSLATILADQRRRDEAKLVIREAVDLVERLTVNREAIRARAYHKLASIVRSTSPEEAVEAWREAIASKRRLLGRHPVVASWLGQQAMTLRRLARSEEAIACYDGALDMLRDRPRARRLVERLRRAKARTEGRSGGGAFHSSRRNRRGTSMPRIRAAAPSESIRQAG